MQHVPINDPARRRFEEFAMRNAPEVVREVGVNDFRVAAEQHLFHLDHCLLGVSPGAVSVEVGWKVLDDQFQHQHRSCHADPMTVTEIARRTSPCSGSHHRVGFSGRNGRSEP
jgi:hypothetical protein